VRDPKVEAYIRMIACWSIRISAKQDVADALSRIERAAPMLHQQSLRLLALRRYLRMQDIKHVDLHTIWTWGDDRVKESMRLDSRPQRAPCNAAPGTSDHGQVKAVDFVVMQGSRLVAGTSRSTIAAQWTAPGWAQRLVEATAGTRLRGPLRHPYEPWHWSLE
jgi:hypothetical protein